MVSITTAASPDAPSTTGGESEGANTAGEEGGADVTSTAGADSAPQFSI